MSRDGRRKKPGNRAQRVSGGQKRLPGESGEGAPAVGRSDSWMALARRFVKKEDGKVHITHPAMELLGRYGYDTSVAIYAHFQRGGSERGARSYMRVGESLSEERIAVEYVPDHDAVVIWRWGEADHDPDLSVLEELDDDA